jgi:hypothetical protein
MSGEMERTTSDAVAHLDRNKVLGQCRANIRDLRVGVELKLKRFKFLDKHDDECIRGFLMLFRKLCNGCF